MSAAGVAAVSAAPTANTGPVTAVGTTSATAGGTVNPKGQATTWYFEYGASTSYGKKTSSRSAGSGTADVQVSGALTGLAAGTTYHYRLVATSAGGTTRGSDGMFTTLSPPRAVTGSATGVNLSAATLNGSVDPNGQPTTWYFEYGTGTGYGAKTSTKSAGSGTAATSVSAALSGLGAGRVYHYRLVATSGAGTSRGADRTFTTWGPPTAVTSTATSVTPRSARLRGRVSPNGLATTWYFEYGTTTSYGRATRAGSAGNGVKPRTVSFALTGLRAATTYHYRLVARNVSGTSRGADLSLATPGVTLSAQAQSVVYGRPIMLSGVVPTGRRGDSLTVFAAEFGRSRRPIATVVTGDGGIWRSLVRPRIRTSYTVAWQGATSGATTIGVRPRVRFRRIGRARFTTRVLARRSFAGRLVKLQRLSASSRWVTVRRVRLKRHSAVSFRVKLRRGTSRLRVVMSVNQAGPGYLAGLSRTIVYRRG